MKERFCILFSAVLMLTACSSVPANLVSEEDATAKEDTPAELAYISPEEMSADIETALSRSYSNFVLREGIKVELPEEYILCDFTFASGRTANAEETAKRYFDEETLERVKPEYTGSQPLVFNETVVDENGETEERTTESAYSRPAAYGFHSEEERAHFYLLDNGFLCFFKPELFDDFFNGGERMGIYHVDRGDDLSDAYQLSDGEMSVQQAADFTRKWLDKNYSDLEPDYEIRVKTIIPRRNDQGEYSFDIKAEKLYKGIPLDELYMLMDTETSSFKYITQDILLQIRSSKDIGAFTTGIGTVVPNETGRLGQIISLSSAMGYLEHTFTDFFEPKEISDINLKYTLTPEYDSAGQQRVDDCGVHCRGHLVWEFVMDYDPEMIERKPGDSFQDGDLRTFIYIDAETGDMDFEFDINKLMQ